MSDRTSNAANTKPPFHSFKEANQAVIGIFAFTILAILARLVGWIS